MSTIMPEGEKLRNAVKWISEKRKENPGANVAKLVDDAGLQFDLSPKDTQFLVRFVRDDTSSNPA